MCFSPDTPPAPPPVAPMAPLEVVKPMALADESSSGRRQGGVSQLRIASKSLPGQVGKAALTLEGRKAALDQAIVASGG